MTEMKKKRQACPCYNGSNGGAFLYFAYGGMEMDYLKTRDARLGAAIDQIGWIERAVDEDLFTSVIYHIIGQQISTRAQETIWQRLREAAGVVNADTMAALPLEDLQHIGISFRKAGYIKDFAERVSSGRFDIEAIRLLPDEGVIDALSALKGVGVWTAEMLLIFCLQRPDVVSFGDLAIQRGLRMLYHHRAIDRRTFAKYAKRYSPYGTVASLYLWAISGGAIAGMRDYAPKKNRRQRRNDR